MKFKDLLGWIGLAMETPYFPLIYDKCVTKFWLIEGWYNKLNLDDVFSDLKRLRI